MQQDSPYQDLGHGITAIDTGFVRPRFDAAYLIVQEGRAAYVDTGTNDALPRLLGALERQGLAPDAVDYLVVTHVHLDHAGAAGSLMRELPTAKLVVHPRGAPHMIDPTVLVKGACAVYGEEEVTRTYGVVQPVAAERVLQTHDGMTLQLAGRPLLFIDTPGHARHHHCIWDEASRGWFTGDTFGISYPEFTTATGRFVLPTTTPVQFDPEAMKASVRRLLDKHPERMYLTHYGCIADAPRFGEQLLEQIDAMVALGLEAGSDDRHAQLHAGLGRLYRKRWRAEGGTHDDATMDRLLAVDVELNAQGLGIWLDRVAGGRMSGEGFPEREFPLGGTARSAQGATMNGKPLTNYGLAGRATVITGAAQGIGAACAERFAREAAPVALWDIDLAKAQAIATKLRNEGAQATAIGCDVSDAARVKAALDETLAAFGRVDVLVNNAGIFKAADFLDVTEADWDRVIAVNLKGHFLVGQACARAMVLRGGGAIVNMSSVNGVMAIPNIASYNASKGAIDQLTRAMALALAERGVRVNAVAPGTIATELAAQAVLTSEAARTRILSRTPLGRLGEPQEVAELVAFLASDAASYLTGQIVYADGGRLALNYTVPAA